MTRKELAKATNGMQRNISISDCTPKKNEKFRNRST